MRLLATTAGLMVVGLGAFEVIMQPSGQERVGALVLFGMTAAGIAAASMALPRLARRLPSLKATVIILGGASLLILVVALAIAGRQMFISEHDLNLLWVLMGFGVVASLAFGLTVSGPLTEDLARISSTSSAIAHGDLAARTGVRRLDEAGRLAHDVDVMAGILEDAEHRRAVEEQARRALFAAVGHDLRTPLASIRAGIEALQDGLAEHPDRYLQSMEADVEALSRLVDDIFLMARFESGDIVLQPELVDLTEIADEAIEVLTPIAAARMVQLRLEAEKRVLAWAAPEAVARVLRNLVDNAIRHSPTGGDVVIAVSNGSRAQCSVHDEGPGFSAEFVGEAFDRFTRDDSSRFRGGGGAGLGLSIAQSYVEILHGEIWAREGPGGTVSFWLPVPDPAAALGSTHSPTTVHGR
jgi:signal transduction histidine kinase